MEQILKELKEIRESLVNHIKTNDSRQYYICNRYKPQDEIKDTFNYLLEIARKHILDFDYPGIAFLYLIECASITNKEYNEAKLAHIELAIKKLEESLDK